MATKHNPGEFDCYTKAGDDEPMFVLLGRDPQAPAVVEAWADERERVGGDPKKVAEARLCAATMRAFHAGLQQARVQASVERAVVVPAVRKERR